MYICTYVHIIGIATSAAAVAVTKKKLLINLGPVVYYIYEEVLGGSFRHLLAQTYLRLFGSFVSIGNVEHASSI